MDIGRRTLLKGIGSLVAAGTAYAGYKEVAGGKWLYDPDVLTASRNRFFGTVDLKTLYKLQQEYSEGSGESATLSAAGVSPEELDRAYGVGGASISGDNGVPSSVVSMALTGSFEASVINDPAEESEMIERATPKTMNGYDLWKAEVPDVSGSSGSGSTSSELSQSVFDPQTGAVGAKKGAAVGGVVNTPETDKVKSIDAVETMIKSKDGGVGAPRHLAENDEYASIRSQFGSEPTVLFGVLVDPAIVSLSIAAYQIILGFVGGFAGPVGGGAANAASVLLEQWVEGFRGGAFGADIAPQGKTTAKLFLTYETASAAAETGIVQLFNAAANSADLDVETVDARYRGESIVIRVTGETENMFESAIESAQSTTPTRT